MTKAGIVEKVAEKLSKQGIALQKSVIAEVVNATIEAMVDALRIDGKLTLKGFGTFSVVQRKAFTARNPRTGEKVKVPASKRVKFTASSTLRDIINKKA